MAEKAAVRGSWLDRAVALFAPERGLRRLRARVATDMLARHYEGAAVGRRTQGWNRSGGDANAATAPFLGDVRKTARDLVRNNPYAESALSTICDHVVGWGIVAKPQPRNKKVGDLWAKWAGTTACDSDGRNDLYGLQKLVLRTVVESGEVLVRRRFRRPEDGLPIPLQLQILDPDHIDTEKNETRRTADGVIVARIIHGVEFDALGRRAAYWLFPEHPGSAGLVGFAPSARIPAESIRHVYKHSRPGQVRGISWFAQVLLRFKDFDEFEDATLMKQKIAACLAVITSSADGSALPLGTTDDTQSPAVDSLEPGMIVPAPPGSTISVVQPPTVREYADYCRTTLRAIATGLGVTYEDLTGDYANMPFSAARMSRLRHWARIEDWRWRMLIPQFCDPVWAWAMEAAQVMSLVPAEAPAAEWTAPPAPMIDPATEGRASMQNVRSGISTLSEVIRERGYDPDDFLAEYAADMKKLDLLKIVLDSDARQRTQAGNPTVQIAAGGGGRPDDDPPDGEDPPDDEEEDDEDDDEEEAEAERAQTRELALIAAVHARAQQPTRIVMEAGAVQVSTPVTIAEGAVRVETPVTIAEGAVHTTVPVTVTDHVELPAGRKVFERDPETHRLQAVRYEEVTPADVRVTGIRKVARPKTRNDGK